MRLTDYLRRFYVEGMPVSELKDILNNNMPGVTATNSVPGTIVIKTEDQSSKYNNVLLTCVKDHFTDQESGKKMKTANAKCFNIHKYLGIKNVEHGDCKTCFLKCLSRDSTKTIFKIKNT